MHVGRIPAAELGVALEAWDPDGKPVIEQEGELVVTKPLPSMPLYFLNDPDGRRYHDSYFDVFPGVWRHGDWITVHSDRSISISGRSDSTLNRMGVRMGSAEIYAVVEQLPEVADSLVIGVERPDGSYLMPLFVVPAEGHRGRRRAAGPDPHRAARPALAPARAGRDRRRGRGAADADRQEARGAGQAACCRAPTRPRSPPPARCPTTTCSTGWPPGAPPTEGAPGQLAAGTARPLAPAGLGGHSGLAGVARSGRPDERVACRIAHGTTHPHFRGKRPRIARHDPVTM